MTRDSPAVKATDKAVRDYFSALAQPTRDEVRATQGKAPAPNELCPLQIDIELARTPTHRSLAELPVGSPWSAKGVADFVCDKAHFVSFSAVKEKEKRNKVLLVATPRLATGWFRQDVNLTVQVLVDGGVKLTKQWEDLTIGSDDNAAARMGALWASSSASQDVVLPANTVRSLSVPRDLGGTTDAASAADRIAITTDTPLLLQGTSDVGADVPVDMVFAAEEYAHQNGSYPIPAPSHFEVYTDFVNVSAEPARVRGQLSWEDGTYSLAPFTIPAHSSYRLWYDNVAGSGDLDLLERKVPADFQHGFFQWSAHGSKGMLLARTHIRPRSGKDSWGFNCYGCCWEYPFGILVPDSVSFNIGGNPYFTASEIDNTCSGQIGPYPAASPVLSYGSPVSWNGSLVSSSNYTSQMLSFSAEAGRVSPTCHGASVTIHGSGPVVVDQCYKNNHPGGTPGAGCNQQTGGCTDCFGCCDQDKEVAKCRCTQAGQNCAATAAAACGTCKQQCFGTFAENCESQNLGCTQ